MLRIAGIIFFFLVTLSFSYSQENDNSWRRIKDDPENYFSIVDAYQTWLNKTHLISKDKIANEKDFLRYVHFWNSRIALDKNGNLSYEEYFHLVKALSENPVCPDGDLANWELVGPVSFDTQNLGLVDEVLFNPNTTGDYLLSPNHGGIWKSQQTGNSWKNVTDDLGLPGIAASEMIRNPFNAYHIIASTKSGEWGTNYGFGMIESFDNGDTWQLMESFPNENFTIVNRLIYDPFDADSTDGITLFAITKNRLYESVNSGISWTEVNVPLLDSTVIHNEFIDIELANNGDLFLTTLHAYGYNGQIFKRSGNTWIDLNPNKSVFGSFQRARITQPDSSKIFLLCDTENDGRQIYKTTDYGESWSFILETPQHDWKNEIDFSPESNIVYIGGIHMHVFHDQSPYVYDTIKPLHVDIRDFEIMGQDNNGYEQVLTATDGGIMMLKINPEDLKDYKQIDLNGNHLPISNFIGMAISNSKDEIIMGGAVHCWTHVLKNNTWSPISGGDGGDCEINWIDPSIYYLQNNELLIKVRDNSFDTIYDGAGWFIGMRYELNPNDPYKVYVGRPGKILIYDEHSETMEIKEVPSEIGNAGALGINNNNDIFVAHFGNMHFNKPFRFVKSLDNGDSWIDISQQNVTDAYNITKELRVALDYCQIMDILFNPINPNEMWICVGGKHLDWNSSGSFYPGKYRVLHSTNGGDSWDDYSEGLTALPAVALEYQMGSNNRIFVGTDAGIFYREPGMNQWECFSEGLPPGLVSDLDYEPCSGYLYASMDSRGIFKTDLPFSSEPLVVSEGEFSWDFTRRMTSDIILEEGAKLTIASNVYMPDGGKIIINPGSKLVINGGKISNLCGGMWHGIEVLGNPELSQNEMNQGSVSIINGGSIENSVYGVYAYKMSQNDTDFDYSYIPGFEGGIVQANDAKFTNNKVAVQFKRYPFLSESYFQSCTFITNDNYLGIENPNYFIRISEVNNIKITNCYFLNESAISYLHDGIFCFDSYMSLDGFCEEENGECTSWDYGLFENLKYGIYAINSTPNKYIDIRHTNFKNNYRGIFIGGTTAPRITSNKFHLNASAGNEGYGLYLDVSTDYWIEDNAFIKCDSCNKQTGIGIIANESGGTPNEIYLNVFENVEFAIMAQGHNRNEKNQNEGLVIRCNEYNHVLHNQTILSNLDPNSTGIAGIAGSQGFCSDDIEDMAGNIFDQNKDELNFGDLYNEASFFDYYSSNNSENLNVKPIDNTTNSIGGNEILTSEKWTFKDACKSKINNSFSSPEELLNDMNTAQTEIESVTIKLNSLIDGGNTEGLNSLVQKSTSSNAKEVYYALMNASPNLSETVVLSVIQKENMFPNAMIRDIMVGNPHTAKSARLIDMLDQRIVPMHDYQKAQVLAARSIISPKQELESKLAGYKLQKANAVNTLIRYYKAEIESQEAIYDSLQILFQSDKTIQSIYKLAWLYLEKGEYQLGSNQLGTILVQYSLTEDEIKEHSDIITLYNLLSDFHQSEKPIESLNENQLAELQKLESNGNGAARAYARNILLTLNKLEYKELILFPDILQSTEAENIYTDLLATNTPQKLNIFPNPSKDYFFLECNQEIDGEGLIEIKDVSGKVVHTTTLTEDQKRISLYTTNWKAGVYIATLIINGQAIESLKFTLVN